jgi:hypothetical protein
MSKDTVYIIPVCDVHGLYLIVVVEAQKGTLFHRKVQLKINKTPVQVACMQSHDIFKV